MDEKSAPYQSLFVLSLEIITLYARLALFKRHKFTPHAELNTALAVSPFWSHMLELPALSPQALHHDAQPLHWRPQRPAPFSSPAAYPDPRRRHRHHDPGIQAG